MISIRVTHFLKENGPNSYYSITPFYNHDARMRQGLHRLDETLAQFEARPFTPEPQIWTAACSGSTASTRAEPLSS